MRSEDKFRSESTVPLQNSVLPNYLIPLILCDIDIFQNFLSNIDINVFQNCQYICLPIHLINISNTLTMRTNDLTNQKTMTKTITFGKHLQRVILDS